MAEAIPDLRAICARYDNDPHRMLDILRDVQDRFRWISPQAMETVAEATGLSRIAVEGVASFYAFLSLEPKGRVIIRLCDDIIDRFAGLDAVTAAFEDALGIEIPANANYIRNLMMLAQYIHDHVVHFYHLHALDWVDIVSALKADPKKTAASPGAPRVNTKW